jgi:uncharacterized protein YlxW (UPF0749 family)
MRQRPDRGQAAVAVLVALLAFGAVVQVRGDDDDVLANARSDELLQILDGLSRQADRLEDQVTELEANRRDLISGADTQQAALAQALERASQLRILTGTAPATGPGLEITVSNPPTEQYASKMLSAVHELRAAGAEAIQIEGDGGTGVRVVADTYFLDSTSGEGMIISGTQVRPPYHITVIGDADQLDEAVSFPQGVISKLERGDATVTTTVFEGADDLTVDVLHEPVEPEYARPAPEDDE